MKLLCPRCRKADRRVERGTRHFPFCSPECKDADLRGWFQEDYRVQGRTIEDAEATQDLENEWPGL